MNQVGRVGAGLRTFQAQSLSCPVATAPKRVNWRYAIAVGSYHLLGLLAFDPWFFSKTGVALAVICVYVFGAAGINLCYHRLLSHRSFRWPLWLEHCFVGISGCCGEETPALAVCA